jgi:poly-gamma-glutamate synthesis protein (capsule biosynthesis protein)
MPTSTPEPTLTPAPSATPTPAPTTVWIDPAVPLEVRQAIMLPAGTVAAGEGAAADLRIHLGEGEPLAQWVYALAARFPTVIDGLTFDELRAAWRGQPPQAMGGQPLLLDQATLEAVRAVWEAPAAGATLVLPSQELLDYAWAHPGSLAVIPFEALEPRWKVLTVDGHSPLWKAFHPAAYALTLPVAIEGDSGRARALAEAMRGSLPSTNRDAGKLTTVVMTGVTALVRATAWTMEQKGLTYPARDIGAWLAEGDITHISNEIAFSPDCPPPDPSQEAIRFCSDPRYIELLDSVGTDVVELTGNHMQDWGSAAMLFTLDLYRQKGWQVFGGGASLSEARQPALFEHNGNKLAFIGCNPAGPESDYATDTRPGSLPCNYGWMHAEAARLRADGYLPIATFQYFEYYTMPPRPWQERDFKGMIEAGAVIVSGSQAHHPQALAFERGALIHYGLGNLFFDQMMYINPFDQVVPGTRWETIDRHVFYNGRHIGTELLTAMLEDYARPRPMTAEERTAFLTQLFAESGW